jgi:hypothetical protein
MEFVGGFSQPKSSTGEASIVVEVIIASCTAGSALRIESMPLPAIWLFSC